MEQLLRNFFLFLSKNKFLTKVAKKYGLRFGAKRFVAGETVLQAVEIIKGLNEKGLSVTVDYLGEFVDSEAEANEMANNSIEAIKAIREHGLDAQVSIKLTSLGLDISEKVVRNNIERILEAAKENDVFITIDMEDFARCEKTLSLFKEYKQKYDNLGTVIQAYLYRTEEDLQELSKYNPNLRIVKGAYKEPAEVAFPEKSDVDENYKKLIQMHLENGHYTAVATHDDAIINFTKELAKEKNIKRDQFEFQMLYGIRNERQLELVQEGYAMRVYVPFGTDWYGYFMRRLAERPANVAFVLKGIFRK